MITNRNSFSNMRIITVLVGDVFSFPPVISLLNAFEQLGIESILITTQPSKSLEIFKSTVIKVLDLDYNSIRSPFQKLLLMPIIKKRIEYIINEFYDEDSLIWIVSDVTLKFLGNNVLNKNYVVHLMELSDTLVYYNKLPFFKMNKERIGNCAKAVVVPEYNRAHITKALWNLDKLPYILPNKPYNNILISKESDVEDEQAKKILKNIGDRKIILYQGIIHPERPLDVFIDAVDEFSGEYAFVVMSGGKNLYEYKKSKNYFFIPFISPPKHLQVTSHAHIGILSYIPTKSTGYSPLNSLYCAPNKTYEYALFGIPMLGNDIPGLKYLFDTKMCGRCFDDFSVKSICKEINTIEDRYEYYERNSRRFYLESDYKEILYRIISSIKKQSAYSA